MRISASRLAKRRAAAERAERVPQRPVYTLAGLYHRTTEIQRCLDARADRYDQVFTFGPLMMAHNVCPPVVQVGYDSRRLHGNAAQTMRLADASYQIVRDPVFAPEPPNWRSYLYLTGQPPAPPDESLLPDGGRPAEVALWEDYVARGWAAGVRQAERTFEIKLAELTRDLKGMALYRELLAKDMVTPPRVDEQFLGLTGHRRRMDVNDRLLTIRAAPTFVRQQQRWKPYPHRASERARKRFLANPIPMTVHRPGTTAPAAGDTANATAGRAAAIPPGRPVALLPRRRGWASQ